MIPSKQAKNPNDPKHDTRTSKKIAQQLFATPRWEQKEGRKKESEDIPQSVMSLGREEQRKPIAHWTIVSEKPYSRWTEAAGEEWPAVQTGQLRDIFETRHNNRCNYHMVYRALRTCGEREIF